MSETDSNVVPMMPDKPEPRMRPVGIDTGMRLEVAGERMIVWFCRNQQGDGLMFVHEADVTGHRRQLVPCPGCKQRHLFLTLQEAFDGHWIGEWSVNGPGFGDLMFGTDAQNLLLARIKLLERAVRRNTEAQS